MPSPLLIFQNVIKRGSKLVSESIDLPSLFNTIGEADKSYKVCTYEEIDLATDMGRSGIVLAAAAMDDYFTRKYSQALLPSIRKRGVTDSLAKVLSEGGLDVKAALELLTMERPYRRVRKIAQDYYAKYSTQRSEKIDALFGTLGLVGLSKHAQSRSKRKTLLRTVEKLVARRHQIVHGGDLNKQGKLQRFDPQEALRRIEAVEVYVENADFIINKYIS